LTTIGLASEQLEKLLQGDLPLGALADILGFVLPVPVAVKQELLQELGVEKRAQHLLHYLQTQDPPQAPGSSVYKFPPDFSAN
jgi:hypothetical protein